MWSQLALGLYFPLRGQLFSEDLEEISVPPEVPGRVKPGVRVKLAPELVVIHVVDLDFVVALTLQPVNSALDCPLLSLD